MKWLIYSELERSRKSAVLSVIFTVLAVGIFVLIALSFNYGNLGKLPIEAKESFFDMNNSVSVPLIAIISGFIVDAAIDGSREDNLCYRLFRRSTPISPLKYSAVNVIIISLYFIIGLGLAFGLSAVVLAVSGLEFTAEHAAAIFFCIEVVLMMNVIMTIFQACSRVSKDKAGIMMIIMFCIPMFIIFLITQGTAFEISQEDITVFFLKLFPFSPLIILGLLAACLLLTAAGIKRREK